jgi:DivIVA domain-containing protein
VSSEESFSRVLRGYDPAEVDTLVQKLRRELLGAKTQHDETIATLKELEVKVAELQLGADLNSSPTVAGLSSMLNNKLKKANTTAAELIRRAETDARFIRSAAEKTSSQFIEAARDDYEAARADALAHARTMESEARAQAHAIVALAQQEADQLRAEAVADASNSRGEASTVAANLRAESRNEIERLKAEAQREIEELKLVLATSRDTHVDVSDEVMQILKLNADGAAVRAEMEKELQLRHQESVMQTEKYIGAAEAQRATAKTRLRALEVLLAQGESEALKLAQEVLEKARVTAGKKESIADKLARKKIADAEKYVAAVLGAVYTQLEDIRMERETVAAFFDALRLELENTLGKAPATKKIER